MHDEIIISETENGCRKYFSAAVMYIAYGKAINVRFAEEGEHTNIDKKIVKEICSPEIHEIINLMYFTRVFSCIFRSSLTPEKIVEEIAAAIEATCHEKGLAIKQLAAA